MYSDICLPDHSLRDYQQEAKVKIFGQWDVVDSVMFQMPTGTGKTRLFTSIIRDINLNSLRIHRREGILIIAHRTELIEQIGESLNRYRIPHGIIAGAFKDKRDLMLPVQVASVQTITHPSNRQLAEKFNASFIIIDEAHHAIANSYTRLWEFYPNAKKLGVTATPWRMDGRGFHGNFDVLLPSMSIKDFMAKGWLAPYQYYSVPLHNSICKDIDAINEYGVDGDYKTSRLEEIVDTAKIRAQLLDSYFQFVSGKKGIIYSISKVHSKHICQQYKDAGIRIADIDSETPSALRKHIVQDFKNGEIDILVNVDIFSEGFDCPNLEFVQLARPTRSLVKYIQQVGRGLRKNGDKQCLILDNVGMYGRFGLPDDDRPWNQYFDGMPHSDDFKSSTIFNDSSFYIGDIREQDLSEGTEELRLIQNINISTDQKFIVPNNGVTDTSKDGNDVDEIKSKTIFSKYYIFENWTGFGIANERSRERQFLCKGIERKSISIKVIKVFDGLKKYMLLSSSNREKTATPNDRIIGYIYKDGKLVRFDSTDKSTTVVVKI